ncbi:chorismate dehydratase [Collibacillus ludicampi]|uniref:Chorismate dehydratase n=1 Tax=Collibacillus ludicampi TaxID=2771369 RepID=A0AAV4LKS0_9BACL|nr:menaquinone biosynthesis protein [Collibacillus ludicampi]GIM48193.1 chorismate dehydratase [Collibacillus ludicampi]
MSKIRIGRISYTNILPIYHFVDTSNPQFEFVPAVPSQLNAWLAEGEIDCGPISSFSYGEHADEYVALRGLSVSSLGPVGSIFLFSKRPIDLLADCTVALTWTSATSVNLLKIILEEYYGVHPSYVTMNPHLPEMMQVAEAALLIGDEALFWSQQKHPYHVYDLGAEWYRNTGLPMTFAVFAVSKRLLLEDPHKVENIHRLFLESKRLGEQHLDQVIFAAMTQCGFSEKFWRSYFSRLIYDFDEHLVSGLEAYFATAHRLGLLSSPAKVSLWGDVNDYGKYKINARG